MTAADDRLLLRSTLAFAALPLLVAYVVPLLLLKPPAHPPRPWGLALAGLGSVILLACVRTFHVRGRGTLAPWDPPRRLVRSGLYRYSRNPMYVGVVLVLAGWSFAWPTSRLWIYAAVVAAAFHVRIVFAEEPSLARSFGDEWTAYSESVPRWIGPPRRAGSRDAR